MDAHQIKVFIDAMASSDLQELEANKDGWTLRLVRQVMPVPQNAGVSVRNDSPSAVDVVCAPVAGVVFLQPAPGEPPFVTPGQSVQLGQVLCVIEAMKVFNEVLAEKAGVVGEVLVASGQDVDADQPLVRLR